MIWWAGFSIASVVFGFFLWLAVQLITAPMLDEEGHVIADPYGTLGPKFKLGDPVPPIHNGRRYS